MPLNFQHSYNQHWSLTKFKSTLDKEPPLVPSEYTSTAATNIFKFAPTLSNLNVSYYLSSPQTCQCKGILVLL